MRRFIALFTIAACSSAPVIPSVRFANAPPVRVVNDRRNLEKPPAERPFVRYLYAFDGQVVRPMTRALELKRHERARGVNALDEVPDSTWFTNRIGVRNVTPEEIRNRPGAIGSPEDYKPWTIVSSKVGGLTVGFIIKDKRGEKFLLKFDPRGFPEAETSAQVIVSRLLWAFGYNTTDDYVVRLTRGDLLLDPEAVVKDLAGNKTPLTPEGLERSLARIQKEPDGSMRGMTSHYLPGKPLGGHPAEGVRDDDPNDRIPHELRRDLRGTYVAFSWLDHNDIHEGQMVDLLVKDPSIPGRTYVKHHFIDFGIALGFAATKNREPRFGHEWLLDYSQIIQNLVTLGFDEKPYAARKRPGLRGIGHYEISTFDPGAWKAHTPAYRPLYSSDRFDKFWASKIMMKFKREHIQAAVDAAKLSDPRASRWLVDAIIARQRKAAAYWFARVNPLDEFAMRPDKPSLCFTDLAIANAFIAPRGSYTVTSYARDSTKLGATRVDAASSVSCADIALSTDPESYTIVRIDTQRASFKGTTFVHVAQEPHGRALRVIGVWRE